jgi:hypothetical protein
VKEASIPGHQIGNHQVVKVIPICHPTIPLSVAIDDFKMNVANQSNNERYDKLTEDGKIPSKAIDIKKEQCTQCS